MKPDPLDAFVEKIINANGPMMNLFSSGVSGAAASALGAETSAGEVMNELKRGTIAFRNTYRDRSSQQNDVVAAAQQVEGAILTLSTLSILDSNQTRSLIAQLYDVVDQR